MARRISVALAVASVGYVGVGWAAATALTRRAHPRFEEPPPPGYEAITLRASDGLRIGAWWRPAPAPRAVVVLAHGNGASRTEMRAIADALAAEGCAVLPISLRAHGDSDGDHNDLGLGARLDIEAAVRHAREALSGVPVVVYGSSLGAAAAVFAAERVGGEVDLFVLVAPYADIRSAVQRRTDRYLPPGLSQLAYGALRLGGQLALPELDRLRPAEAARHVPASARVLLVAGADDDRAPPSDARAIAARIPDPRVVVVPGLGHDGLLPETAEWAEVVAALPPAAATSVLP